ncbi:type VI secretion system baseplate subunit TssE [Catenovulum sp. SM1970]|uniref:type VI secretion system baseplate subunit TssE n=1 Tax=Marinifaba aquimaris TaxID=2741323 RepID=UPI0015733BED|nr:type VI secretion system baseplate subunit TssE [Marinifaba aquimaris]NTS75652.1 type VI secretion system baseplate subunit TssE [Marinifaba aquimaris]
MPELSQKERLQLSLLDRLTDDEPDKQFESREKRVISVNRLRQLVQRDIAWLLNSVSADASIDMDDFPYVKSSTINYGIPELAGRTSAVFNAKQIEREVARCVKQYEPRIIASTLKVKVHVNKEEMSNHTLSFEISGDLWAQPLPLQLFLKTEVDLENGHVQVTSLS